jgi:hypothetical protein
MLRVRSYDFIEHSDSSPHSACAWLILSQVGPLPPTPATEVLPLDFCYNSGRNYVRNSMPNLPELELWACSTGSDASDITLALLDGVSSACLHELSLLLSSSSLSS